MREIFPLVLRPTFWKPGFAKEAAIVVIEYGFGTLPADRLFAGDHPANHVSRQLLLRLGFVQTHEELYPPTGLMNTSYLLRRTPAPCRPRPSIAMSLYEAARSRQKTHPQIAARRRI